MFAGGGSGILPWIAARTGMHSAPVRCGPRPVSVRPAVTVVGKIPSRPFLGWVVVARPARGEYTSAVGTANPVPHLVSWWLGVKRRYFLLDCLRQSYSFLWSPTEYSFCCHRPNYSFWYGLAVRLDVLEGLALLDVAAGCSFWILMLLGSSCKCLLLGADVDWSSGWNRALFIWFSHCSSALPLASWQIW